MEFFEMNVKCKCNQIIIVEGSKLYFADNEKNKWKMILQTNCIYGKNGFSSCRIAGDKTTPIGVFPLLYAFGTEKNVNTKMKYRKITKNSYFSDDEENLKEYNTWVESTKPINGEHLIDYPKEYHYGIVIGFNINPKIKGIGSSIFLHCIGDKNYTAGCIAIEEADMVNILKKIENGAWIFIKKK